MDFDFRYDEKQNGRGSFRASVPGLSVVSASGVRCAVKDVSVSGVGFVCDAGRIAAEPGSILVLNLMLGNKLYISGLEARVVRVTDQGVVACTFVNRTRNQEMRLDKLMLEMQKKIIALRKAKEEAARAAAQQRKSDPTKPIVLDV